MTQADIFNSQRAANVSCSPALSHTFPTDQIDENLKLTLQEDLTSMAPGLIIQVQAEAAGQSEAQ